MSTFHNLHFVQGNNEYDYYPQVDDTLSVEGRAADAKTTGEKFDEIKNDLTETTRNLFDGTVNNLLNSKWVDGKIINTNVDSRASFVCIVRFRNGTTNIAVSDAVTINTLGRVSITVTPTSSGDNVYIVHNGATRNIAFAIPFDFSANLPYTVSFDVEGYDVQTVGGLVLSKIQLEQNNAATDYVPHITAVDENARKSLQECASDSELQLLKTNVMFMSESSRNLFDGRYSGFSNMELDNGKIKNTNTDTRASFFYAVRFMSGNTIIASSDTIPTAFIGRNSVTVTPAESGDNIMILHNGATKNFSCTIPFDFVSGTTYTVSLNIEGYDVRTIGGLILSDIQIEEGDTATPYIPRYTAMDFVARGDIDASVVERNLNILLMGDSIFGNDGEIALFLNQMCGKCTNGAFGGTRVSVRPYTSDNFRYFDGVNIITALCSQIWTSQETAAENLVESYPWIASRLATLQDVNMSDIDLLIMNWGTNDYTGSATVEEIITAYDTIIDILQETYPELRILITTPIWRYWGTEADNQNGDNKIYNASTLKEISLAIEQFAKDKRISVLNAYQNMPLSYKTALTYYDADDKTHLNAKGNKVYAYLLHGKIRSIY